MLLSPVGAAASPWTAAGVTPWNDLCTITLPHGAPGELELVQVGISFPCLQRWGVWGKGTLAELGWGNHTYSAEVN